MRYSISGASTGKMKAYSIDLREKIVQAYVRVASRREKR